MDSPVDCAGQTCPAGTQCVGGQCVSPCGGASGCLAGLICCSGACIDTAINTAHCGTCDRRLRPHRGHLQRRELRLRHGAALQRRAALLQRQL